ncbi:MAG: hypothetical protein KTR31_13225 [Myxococcales bacterium]|nr:hypothetical protein [Myxococcales bacterium]
MLLLLSSQAAQAACTFEATVEGLDAALANAEQAYVSLDLSAFQNASTEADFLVPCLAEPVQIGTAARLHRLRGLGYFADGDRDAMRASLWTARHLQPQYVFPESMLPVGFELRDLYEDLAADAGETKRLSRPREGALFFDGQPTRERPLSRAALFQRADGSGAVVHTTYLAPGDEVPWYPGIRTRRTRWLLGSAGVGLAAGVLYGFAWQSFTRINQRDPGWTDADLQRLRTQNNVLFWSSTALAVTSVGGLAVALRVDR